MLHTPLERERAESALIAHLAALSLPPLPVRWIVDSTTADVSVDAAAGFLSFWRGRSPSGLYPVSPRALYEAQREAEKAERSAGGARKEARVAGEAALKKAMPSAHIAPAELAAVKASESLGSGAKAGAWLSDKAAKGMLGVAGALVGTAKETMAAREAAHASAGGRAANAAMWLARAHVLKESGWSNPSVEKMAGIYLPLIDAVEAGLWLCWFLPDEILAVASSHPGSRKPSATAAPPRVTVKVPHLPTLGQRPSSSQVRLAKKLLKKGGFEQAVAALRGDLKSQQSGAFALGELGDPRAIPPLVDAMRTNADNRLHIAGYEALGLIAKVAPDAMRPLLKDQDPHLRAFAALGLGWAGHRDVAAELAEGMRTITHGLFRQRAREILPTMGDAAVEAFLELASDTDNDLRYRAAIGLGDLRDPRGVDQLIVLLGDQAEYVRWAAATALGQIGDPRAVQPLTKLLSGDSDRVREEAGKAIGTMGG